MTDDEKIIELENRVNDLECTVKRIINLMKENQPAITELRLERYKNKLVENESKTKT